MLTFLTCNYFTSWGFPSTLCDFANDLLSLLWVLWWIKHHSKTAGTTAWAKSPSTWLTLFSCASSVSYFLLCSPSRFSYIRFLWDCGACFFFGFSTCILGLPFFEVDFFGFRSTIAANGSLIYDSHSLNNRFFSLWLLTLSSDALFGKGAEMSVRSET